MFLNSHWKQDTPGSISQSVFEDILLRLPSDRYRYYLNLSRFIHTFDMRLRRGEQEWFSTHFVFNLREWEYLSHRSVSQTDFLLLYGTARRVQALKCNKCDNLTNKRNNLDLKEDSSFVNINQCLVQVSWEPCTCTSVSLGAKTSVMFSPDTEDGVERYLETWHDLSRNR